jgi:uncharacterized membrane protein
MSQVCESDRLTTTPVTKYFDLVVICFITLSVAVVVGTFPDWQSPVRVGLGLIVVLLVPGYALMSALFPGADDIDGVGRLALTLGLSIVAVPLVGLILNYLPWGIRLQPMLVGLSLWVLVFAGAAAVRRSRLEEGEAFALDWRTPGFRQGSVLFALVLGVLLGVPALAVALRPAEQYTEFYVLGSEGQLQAYPTRLEPGESFELTFGVGNREGRPMRYRLSVPFDAERASVLTPTIEAGERWEETLMIVAPTATGRTRLPFELYRLEDEEPYRSLHLFVTFPGQTLIEGEWRSQEDEP